MSFGGGGGGNEILKILQTDGQTNDGHLIRKAHLSLISGKLKNIHFFEKLYLYLQVCNNGFISFIASSLPRHTSESFPINGSHKIIAPFWSDVDTNRGGKLWYRTTMDRTTLLQANNEISLTFQNTSFLASWMMVVTWEDVAAYGCSSDCSQDCINCDQVRVYIFK